MKMRTKRTRRRRRGRMAELRGRDISLEPARARVFPRGEALTALAWCREAAETMAEETPEDQAAAVKRALFAGNKIEAIKLYREQMKVGLAESKAAVEALEAELRQS